jgi:hypothetical protein
MHAAGGKGAHAMNARLTPLLITILALAFAAGCTPSKRYWPAEVTKPAKAAVVSRGEETTTIVTRTTGNDGEMVSPTDLGYNSALLRAAREMKAAGFSRFEVIKTDTHVISDLINQVGAPQRVRYTMTIRPVDPADIKTSRKHHNTADVLAGPRGGYL